jgi:hypothetical protein
MPEKFGFLEKDQSFWLEALKRYPAALDLVFERKGKSELLLKLMQQFHNHVNAHEDDGLGLEELTELITVKLLHSKTRPGFMARITKNNSIPQIKSITAQSFHELQALKFDGMDKPADHGWKVVSKASKELCKLYGIGIATASLILSKYHPQIPFMSDQVLHEIVVLPTQSKLKYNENEFRTLYQKLDLKYLELNKDKDLEAPLLEPSLILDQEVDGNHQIDKKDDKSKESTKRWSLRSMQYAIWAYHITEIESLSKKRKWVEVEDRKKARLSIRKGTLA